MDTMSGGFIGLPAPNHFAQPDVQIPREGLPLDSRLEPAA